MSLSPQTQPARMCVLTPDGRGAIAVVRVWGPAALAIADAVFRPRRGRSLATSAPGVPRLGRMGAGLGDEVIAVVVEGAEPEVEVHCHGGSAAVALVAEALQAAGAERRQPVAWVRHASRSAVAAEAEVDLVRAATVRTAEILLEQTQGALEDEVRRGLARLPDEPAAVVADLEELLRRAEIGLRLATGWHVVLAGRPNVGKSRLLNALAGFDRAIVAPLPGTTRDVVTARVAFDGWPIELADTAGLRDPADAIEAQGVERARARHGEADLVVLVLDRSEPLCTGDRSLLEAHPRALLVASKCDLPAAWDAVCLPAHAVSAQRGDGIEALGLAIARRLVPSPPSPGAGVPFRPRQVRRIEDALRALRAGDLSGAKVMLNALLARLPDRDRPDRKGV